MKSNKMDTADTVILVGLLCVLVGLCVLWGWPVMVLVLGIILVATGYRMAAVGK